MYINLRMYFGLFLLLFFVGNIEAQQTFSYQFNSNSLEGSIYRLTSENQFQFIVTLDTSCPVFGDIAVHPNGDIYGLSQDGFIHVIDLDAGTSTELGNFAGENGHSAFACDINGLLYTLDYFGNVIAYDLETNEETELAFIAEPTPGDVCFYNGKIIYITTDDKIKAIDLETEEVTTIYCIPEDIVPGLAQAWGIANSFQNCGTEYIWISNSNNDLFLIDIEASTYENLNATYDMDAGGVIYGMASSNDGPASTCQGDVTAIDCEEVVDINEEKLSFIELPFYPNPAQNSITLHSPETIISLRLLDMRGRVVKEISDLEAHVFIGDVSTGIYMLEVENRSGEKEVFRLVKE